MNNATLCGVVLDVKFVSGEMPRCTITMRCNGVKIKATCWRKVAILASKIEHGSHCLVTGRVNIDTWPWEEKNIICADLKLNINSCEETRDGIDFSHVEIMGQVVKSYGEGSYMVLVERTVKGKVLTDYVPIKADRYLRNNTMVHVSGPMCADSNGLNIAHKAIQASNLTELY